MRRVFVSAIALLAVFALAVTPAAEARARARSRSPPRARCRARRPPSAKASRTARSSAVEQLSGALSRPASRSSWSRSTIRPSPTSASPTPRTSSPTPTILAVVGHLNSGVAIPSSEVYKDSRPGHDLRRPTPTRSSPTGASPRASTASSGAMTSRARWPPSSRSSPERQERLHRPRQDRVRQGCRRVLPDDHVGQGTKSPVRGFEGTEEKANFDPIITPMNAQNPDVIFFGGNYPQAGPLPAGPREGDEVQVPGAGRRRTPPTSLRSRATRS